MKTRIVLSALAAAAVVAACASASRPGRDPELMAAYRGTQAPSIYGLLGARERLGLTSAQVTALDSIAEALRTGNRVLTDSLRDVTGARPGGPLPPPRDSLQRARFVPVLQRIGANNRRAVQAVEALLSAEQRQTVCTLAVESRPEGEMVRFGAPGDNRRRRMDREAMGDTLMRAGGGRTWPWCAQRPLIRHDSLRPRTERD